MRVNPIAGGPDFVSALRNAIEGTAKSYTSPPAAGGTQISCRFSEDRLAILDGICAASKWNRNQAINALLDNGLFHLFQQLGDEATAKILGHSPENIVPTFDIPSDTLRRLASFNRFRIHPAPQKIRSGQLPTTEDMVWLLGSPPRGEDLTFDLGSVGSNWRLPLHVSHVERIHSDTVRDATDGFRNAILELNMQIVMVKSQISLVPLSNPLLEHRNRALRAK